MLSVGFYRPGGNQQRSPGRLQDLRCTRTMGPIGLVPPSCRRTAPSPQEQQPVPHGNRSPSRDRFHPPPIRYQLPAFEADLASSHADSVPAVADQKGCSTVIVEHQGVPDGSLGIPPADHALISLLGGGGADQRLEPQPVATGEQRSWVRYLDVGTGSRPPVGARVVAVDR